MGRCGWLGGWVAGYWAGPDVITKQAEKQRVEEMKESQLPQDRQVR